MLIRIEGIIYENEEFQRLKSLLSKNAYFNHIIKEAQLLIQQFNKQKQNKSPTKGNIYFIMNYYENSTLLFVKHAKRKCAKLIPNIDINFAF